MRTVTATFRGEAGQSVLSVHERSQDESDKHRALHAAQQTRLDRVQH